MHHFCWWRSVNSEVATNESIALMAWMDLVVVCREIVDEIAIIALFMQRRKLEPSIGRIDTSLIPDEQICIARVILKHVIQRKYVFQLIQFDCSMRPSDRSTAYMNKCSNVQNVTS